LITDDRLGRGDLVDAVVCGSEGVDLVASAVIDPQQVLAGQQEFRSP
jgi:hypothetical protein